MGHALEIDGVEAGYGTKTVIKGLLVNISQNEIVAIIGLMERVDLRYSKQFLACS